MKCFLVLIATLFYLTGFSQNAIKGRAIYKSIQYLSADELKGRWPGTAGDSLAEKYIINAFKKSGIAPLFPKYIQPFEVTVKLDAPATENEIVFGNSVRLKLNNQYSIFPFSGDGSVTAKVVSGTTNDIVLHSQKNSPPVWMVLWRQKPFAPASDSLSDYALSNRALQCGAVGVILISPDTLDKKDVLVRLRPRNDKPLPIPVIQVTRTAWKHIEHELFDQLQGADIDRRVSDRTLTGTVRIRHQTIVARNIAGIIKGNDPQLQNEYIVLGAHYDHLGFGGYGTGSLQPDTTAIHNGADDNASGTAALLAIANALQRNRAQLKRSVIVIAFAAEEEGLLGSRYFTDHLPVPQAAIRVMLNMDMVGRLNTENQLYMGGAGTFPGGVAFMKGLGEGAGLNLVVHAGGVGGSDHVSFYWNGISCIGLHTGGHPQYHTPADDAQLINVAGIEKVARYIYRAVAGLSVRENNWGFIRQD